MAADTTGEHPTDTPSGRAADRTTEELRRLIRSAPRTPGRAGALAQLAERAPRGLNRTLTALAGDATLDQAMRVEAVAILGRETTASALEGLRSVLETDDQVVVQRAIERLGKVGTVDDLERLRGLRSGNGTTQRVLRAAKCFLSYRHRLGDYRVDVPKQRFRATGEARDIVTGAPTKEIRTRFELRPPPVPGIGLAPLPVRRLECGPNHLALVVNQELVDTDGVATLTARQAIPAVITRYNNETGAYDPKYYLLTDPVRGTEFRIIGLRGSGRAGLHGVGAVHEDAVTFEVNATEQPLDHPMTVSGTYDIATGTIRFDVALVDPGFSATQQRRRKQPRPAE